MDGIFSDKPLHKTSRKPSQGTACKPCRQVGTLLNLRLGLGLLQTHQYMTDHLSLSTYKVIYLCDLASAPLRGPYLKVDSPKLPYRHTDICAALSNVSVHNQCLCSV